ncbi:MAG: hypothetical protein JW840_09155 [Candidatus Thermoplasmatota archaeon]|nr:hypothetical protein [Candidatus Thermoplasmatota archaeon]
MQEKHSKKHVLNKRITKTFSTDTQTLNLINDFMEKYHSSTISETIDFLVNIGLANFGYSNDREIEQRMKNAGIYFETLRVQGPKFDIDWFIVNQGLSDEQRETMITIFYNISKLLMDHKEKLIHNKYIMKEAKIKGIESQKVEEALTLLLRSRKIFKMVGKEEGKYGNIYYGIRC